MTQRDPIQWVRYAESEAFVLDRLSQLVVEMPPVQAFEARLGARTNSRLVDWLDHLILADGQPVRERLASLGFEPENVQVEADHTVYHHPGAIFPRLVLRAGSQAEPGASLGVAILVEELALFLMTQGVSVPIEGTPLSPYRRARVWAEDGRALWAVERRGHSGFVPLSLEPDYAQLCLDARQRWATRPRHVADPLAGLEQTLALARSLVADLGVDLAAWVAFEVERDYWQQRNWAGQVQKSRQDSLGLGWANHDHHTFRSSRETFGLLIQILETLGFRPRERFYAGAEAGWGAQVMEQPVCRFAVFADVDLAPEEVESDFAHEPLPPRQELGTVGLWCALHGESMLAAGLHHLAARLDFDAATAGLAGRGVEMMRPFSDFSYLRQAFTRGERWNVSPERLERLLALGRIDADQRTRFAEAGALGSHLENIQRGEGFKGFNQHTVSDIIRRTDPRSEFGAT